MQFLTHSTEFRLKLSHQPKELDLRSINDQRKQCETLQRRSKLNNYISYNPKASWAHGTKVCFGVTMDM